MQIAIFDTALTEAQWAVLRPMLPKAAKPGWPTTDRRRIIDALLYIVKGIIDWRLPPKSFPEGRGQGMPANHRWVAERTFGWLMRHRRLVRDYETTRPVLSRGSISP